MTKFVTGILMLILFVLGTYIPNAAAGASIFACLNPTTNQIRIVGTDCDNPTVPKAGPRQGNVPPALENDCTLSELEIEWQVSCDASG